MRRVLRLRSEQDVGLVVLIEAAVVLVEGAYRQIFAIIHVACFHVQILVRLLVHLGAFLDELTKKIRVQKRLINGLIPLSSCYDLDLDVSLFHCFEKCLLDLFNILHIRLYNPDALLRLPYNLDDFVSNLCGIRRPFIEEVKFKAFIGLSVFYLVLDVYLRKQFDHLFFVYLVLKVLLVYEQHL